MDKKTLLFGGSGAGSRAGDLGLLVLRLVMGLTLALAHGWGKMPPPERFVDGVAEMGFPFPTVFAWAAGLSEFAGGFLIALGLLVRPAAVFVLVTMATAFFVRHAADPFAMKELSLLFGAIALALVCTGGGRYTFDRMIYRG